MENALVQSNSKFCLIGKINGLALQSKQARRRLNKSAAKKNLKGVWRAAYRKTIIGIDTRHHLLAYAFLRGIPYHTVEKKCGEFNLPNAASIFKIVEAHAPTWIPFNHITKTGGKVYKASLNDVNVWLAGGC